MQAVAPPITRRFKAVFASGSMAEAIVFSVTGQFTLLYYNQVRGVPPEQVGLAIAIGIVANAVFEPLVGSWSDRTRSRWGRRHPFMFAAMLPIALSFFAMFAPPSGLSQTGELVWLGVTNFILLQGLTAYHTPHLAFGGELSPSYAERSRIMSWNTFFLWAGDTACWLLSFGWFFHSVAGQPNGALEADRWPRFIGLAAAAVFAILFVSSVFTRSRIRFAPQAPADLLPFGLAQLWRDVRTALANRNFVMLLLSYTFLSVTSGVRAGLWLYGATYYWQISNEQIAFFALGSFVSYVFGSGLVARLHLRFEKRWTGAAAVLCYSVGPAIPFMLGHFGILEPQTPGLVAILIAFSVLQHFPYSVLTTTIYSAMADIADENELRFGIRQEGVFYSTSTLFGKVDQALGSTVAGWVLAVIAFPAHAVPGAVGRAILDQLALAVVVFAVPGVVAAWFFSRVKITRAGHAAVEAALEARRGPIGDPLPS